MDIKCGTIPKTPISTLNLARTRRSARNGGLPPSQRRMRTKTNFVTQKELRGGRLHMPENPPDVNFQPWCPITVIIHHTGGELKDTVKDLTSRLVKQIDPLTHAFRSPDDKKVNVHGGPLMQIRLKSVRAWNLTGHMIALSVNDLTANTKTNVDTLCGLVDTGSNGHTPAVGFEYPQSHRDIVFHNDGQDMDDPIFHIITPAGDNSVVYVQVWWRCDGPSKFTSFNNIMLGIMNNIKGQVTSVNKNVAVIKQHTELLKKIEEHTDKGGIGSAVVKGVEVVAPYVIPAIAAEDRATVDRLTRALERQSLSSASSFSHLGDDCT